MKILLLLGMLLVQFNCFAQSATGNPLKFEGIIKTDTTLKKSKLFVKSLEWFTSIFKNANAVIQIRDQEAGIVEGKFSYSSTYKAGLAGTQLTENRGILKISVKDGKIKYEIHDLLNESYGEITDGIWMDKGLGKTMRINIYAALQQSAKQEAVGLIASMTNYFTNLKAENDW